LLKETESVDAFGLSAASSGWRIRLEGEKVDEQRWPGHGVRRDDFRERLSEMNVLGASRPSLSMSASVGRTAFLIAKK